MKRLLAVVSALLALAAPGGAQSGGTIRVATLPTEAGAQVFYAKEMGFFAKAGLDVRIQPISNGAAIASAVAAHAVDVGWTTPISLALAHEKKVPFVVIAPASVYTSAAPFSALFVAESSPIRTASDLQGKVIAANGLGTITEYGPRFWIDRNGGDSAKVKFVELAFSAMPAALAAGRVDAAEIAEPDLAIARKNGRVLAYPMDAIAKEFLLGAWFTTAGWAKEHRDLAQRFAAVMRETAIWANQKQNQARSGEILTAYAKIDPSVLPTMVRARYGERLDPASMQPVIDLAARYGHFATFPARELLP